MSQKTAAPDPLPPAFTDSGGPSSEARCTPSGGSRRANSAASPDPVVAQLTGCTGCSSGSPVSETSGRRRRDIAEPGAQLETVKPVEGAPRRAISSSSGWRQNAPIHRRRRGPEIFGLPLAAREGKELTRLSSVAKGVAARQIAETRCLPPNFAAPHGSALPERREGDSSIRSLEGCSRTVLPSLMLPGTSGSGA